MRVASARKPQVQPPDLNGLHSADALAEIIGVPHDRVARWIAQDLLEPTETCDGTLYFDFAKVSAAQTLRDLSASGASLSRLRSAMNRLRRWVPRQRTPAPIVPVGDALHVRVKSGELADPNGQLCLEFGEGADPLPMHALPRTPDGWFARGCAHEADDELDAAVSDYRHALRAGGPDARIAFALAHALARLGRHESAAERYLQVIELDPQNGDAWNNLGAVLCGMDLREQACDAFRHAVEIDPGDARAHYNLADTLDELGRGAEAEPHYRQYLRRDSTSAWAAHARHRIGSR